MAAKDNFFYPKKTLKIKGKVYDLSHPKVMGIINLTPDSFYKNSRSNDEKSLIHHASKMVNEGADILDLGAFSSRPNFNFISEEEEWNRLKFGLKIIIKNFPDIPVSIDTFRSEVVKRGIDHGIDIVNDISGGQADDNMLNVVADADIPYIIMHIKDAPEKMHTNYRYENLLKEIFLFFDITIKKLLTLGHNDHIIDPGIGFSKTLAQNYEILKNLDYFKVFNVPILIGVSRKSLIYKTLEISPENALNGTTVLNTFAAVNGASILRVHDVKEAKEVITLTKLLSD